MGRKRMMIALALAAPAAALVAAGTRPSAGPLRLAARRAEGDTAAMTAEVALSIQPLAPQDNRSLVKAGEMFARVPTAEPESERRMRLPTKVPALEIPRV